MGEEQRGMNDLKDDEVFTIEVVVYVAITVIFVMVIGLMLKLLWNWDDEDSVDAGVTRPSETSGVLSSKVEGWVISYGTSEKDIESSTNYRSCTSSSDDLYDGKLCVICFDDQRSCFFIPCGHYITCYTCAKRIISEEIKSCPMCRTYIDKVRKLNFF